MHENGSLESFSQYITTLLLDFSAAYWSQYFTNDTIYSCAVIDLFTLIHPHKSHGVPQGSVLGPLPKILSEGNMGHFYHRKDGGRSTTSRAKTELFKTLCWGKFCIFLINHDSFYVLVPTEIKGHLDPNTYHFIYVSIVQIYSSMKDERNETKTFT